MIRVKRLAFEQQGWDRRVYIAKPVAEWMYIVQSYEPKYPTTVWQWRTSDTLKLSDDVGSYDSAVAACQAHYDAMILSQIEVEALVFTSITVGVTTLPDVWEANPRGDETFGIWVDGGEWYWCFGAGALSRAESYEDAVAKCNARWRQVVLSGVSKEQERA